jgi:hypothetical protein
MRIRLISMLLSVGAILAASAAPASAWWQFVAQGPHGERQVSPHYESQSECKAALKVTEAALAKKFPGHYPLVGSCEEYRYQQDRSFD